MSTQCDSTNFQLLQLRVTGCLLAIFRIGHSAWTFRQLGDSLAAGRLCNGGRFDGSICGLVGREFHEAELVRLEDLGCTVALCPWACALTSHAGWSACVPPCSTCKDNT